MPIVAPAPAARAYEGPECPRCKARLTSDWIRTGIIECPDCRRAFEATSFNPPLPRLRVAEVTMTPEGSNACANHARNAAVTNCQRCGLFICALCDMSVGSGSYCPACFDRLRAEGSLKGTNTRYRDYARMATISMVVGLFFSSLFVGWMFGIVSVIYARKGIKQRQQEERSTVGVRIVAVFALLEIIGGLGSIVFMILVATGRLK
jgi:uncharacterized paraquat-inducible protein A